MFGTASVSRPQVGSATHVGLIRQENEDALAVAADGRLLVVADGMGGHARGAWAAQTICGALGRMALPAEIDAACEAIADELAAINDGIVAEAARAGSGTIGSTVVALCTDGRRYACLWAGDSRIYLLRHGQLRQLTRDHSQVEELVAAGVLTREQARDHPLGNVITRAIGVAPGLALDVVEDAIQPGDRFLLCSDGLTKVVPDEELAQQLAARPPEAVCAELVRLVLARGAPDNVSLVVLAIP